MPNPHKFLLLAADPEEGVWSIIAQSDNPDIILDAIGMGDPSLRIPINTQDYVTFDPREKRENDGAGEV